jgi:hypothetical protein
MAAARVKRPVKIPTKKAALRLVADHVAGNLGASAADEILGSIRAEESLTPTEAIRLGWAVDEVIRRLYAMGGKS